MTPTVPRRCSLHDRYDDCPDASTGAMSRGELDSLTVVRSGEGAELRNSAGFVAWFPDRDEAYAEVRRLRGVA